VLASPFSFQYPLFSCWSSSNCCFRNKIWPVQLPFHRFIVCRIFLSSLSLCGTAVAQWLRCRATNRNVTGSIPAGVSSVNYGHSQVVCISGSNAVLLSKLMLSLRCVLSGCTVTSRPPCICAPFVIRSPGRPVHSQSLYRLRYLAHCSSVAWNKRALRYCNIRLAALMLSLCKTALFYV